MTDAGAAKPAIGPDRAKKLFAITIFVDDLAKARQWYGDVFGMPIVDESPTTCSFGFPGGVFINLNVAAAAEYHLGPGSAPLSGAKSREMVTLVVDDVDAIVERLVAVGVTILHGPVTEAWGPRAATFEDPSGNFWEITS